MRPLPKERPTDIPEKSSGLVVRGGDTNKARRKMFTISATRHGRSKIHWSGKKKQTVLLRRRNLGSVVGAQGEPTELEKKLGRSRTGNLSI